MNRHIIIAGLMVACFVGGYLYKDTKIKTVTVEKEVIKYVKVKVKENIKIVQAKDGTTTTVIARDTTDDSQVNSTTNSKEVTKTNPKTIFLEAGMMTNASYYAHFSTTVIGSFGVGVHVNYWPSEKHTSAGAGIAVAF